MANPFRTVKSGSERKSVSGSSRLRGGNDPARHREQDRRPPSLRRGHRRVDLGNFAFANPEAAVPWMMGGLLGGLIIALVTVFKKTWAPLTAPLYALLEGLALGGISAIFEHSYPGVAMQAFGLTFGTLFVMLLAYKTGLIRATQGFKVGVIAATGGIAVFYLVEMVLGFLHIQVPAINGSGPWGIGFSLFVVVLPHSIWFSIST